VLGADVVVLERARLFLRKDHYLAGSLCESLEHLHLHLSIQDRGVVTPNLRGRNSTGGPNQFLGSVLPTD
jgi:hypothetical protein